METKIVTRQLLKEQKDDLHDLHPVLRRIFLARGVFSKDHIEYKLSKLESYHKLLNIEQASELLFAALSQQHKITIIGDFDADGATSTALAVDFLRNLGANVSYIVPNRFEYGYGLTKKIVDLAQQQQQPDLIVTVDNGIASLEGAAYARQLGIKVLITDHHLPLDKLPVADVIVNPNQKGDLFPSKSLSGVGVIFYVMLALRARLRAENWFKMQQITEPNMLHYLDLVALGTVADLVPLDYNNRILVFHGLKRMLRSECRVGIQALFATAKRDLMRTKTSDLSFAIAPRLNAAGRLHDMSVGIECLLSEDYVQALKLSQQLDALNQERKNIEEQMKFEALEIIHNIVHQQGSDLPLTFCLYDASWHQGVVGIVASRIKELYNRPAIIFSDEDAEYIKGSCRSIDGLHLKDALDKVAQLEPELLVKYGGHAMAAGLSIRKDNLAKFQQVFTAVVETLLEEHHLNNVLETDGKLAANDLTLEFYELLRRAGPWGQAFPEPCFEGVFSVVDYRIVAEKHLKLNLKNTNAQILEAIYFNGASLSTSLESCEQLKVVYRLESNTYRDNTTLNLHIEHVHLD